MFHLYTVASDESKLTGLRESIALAGQPTDMLKILKVEKWRGFIDKIMTMKRCVDSLPDTDIVCFIDAYDVLCFSGIEEIHTKFLEHDADIVFSSELNCYPSENLPRYDLIEYNLFERSCEDSSVRPIETNYKYVNSGGYVGKVAALKRMFAWKSEEEIEAMIKLGGDQNFFTQYFLEFCYGSGGCCDRLVVDDMQRIFQSLYKVDLSEFGFFRGRIYNHALRTYPCFIHFNGYHAYNWLVYHVETGQGMHAMECVLEKIKKSHKQGNAVMDYRLRPFYYGGVPQGNITQMIWGEGWLRKFTR
jgi:hypothetical protein